MSPSIKRKCIICGCSQLRACATSEGPCHWVDRHLCSACVGAVCMIGRPGVIVFPSGDFMEDADRLPP
jgi:hypothetical protein